MSTGLNIEDKLANLQLKEKSAISLGKVEPDYVLDFAVQKCDGVLAATSSSYNIRLYSRKDLTNIGCIKGHTDVVTGISFGKSESNLLYSSSQDETIRCWDLRTGFDKEAQVYKVTGIPNAKLTCVDADTTEKLLCAGTEQVDDGAYIVFWDRRKNEILGCYGDSHQEDIIKVRFHPSNKDQLLSGCGDGLVCLFDVSQSSEDDALLYTFNAECSVSNIGWYGSSGTNVYCATSIDTFHVWDTVEGDEKEKALNIKEKLEGSSQVDYIVDVLHPELDNTDLLVAGTYSGDARIVELVDDDVKVLTSLSGHRDRIRCCHYDQQSETLVTGGEDSLLCLWSTEASRTDTKTTSKSKSKMKRKGRTKSQPY